LTVAHCHTHEVSFTIYPPAHVPYGRAAVTPVDLEGRRVIGIEGGKALALAGTVWEPIADAERGKRWPDAGGDGSRRTQGRRLELGASLFGLLSGSRVRESIAVALRVPALALHEAAASYPARGRWRDRAGALLSLLRLSLRGKADVLLTAGHIGGLWGRPSRWDPGGSPSRALD
jgi:hypothetical protein